MSKFLFPTEYYDSTYSIDFEHYYRLGYRAVLFDIDNTLVPHDFPSDERSEELLHRLMTIGFRVCFVSNNKEPRVASFNEKIGAEYVFKAGKPKNTGYKKAMEMLGTTRGTTLFVGDQLYTDIWGANRAGIHSILVKPIDKHEEIQIVLKRFIEKPFLWLWLMKHKMKTK